jgi:hypothetical protein
MTKRLYQILLIGTFLPLCWLLMQAVHELGHVAAGIATSGTVAKVVLHPLAISRTDTSGSLHPLLVVWAGPMAGVLIPFALLALGKGGGAVNRTAAYGSLGVLLAVVAVELIFSS